MPPSEPKVGTLLEGAVLRKVEAHLRALLESDGRDSPEEIRALAAKIKASLAGQLVALVDDLSRVTRGLYAEIDSLRSTIQSFKDEIAALRPRQLRDRGVPAATDALQAVVDDTERATQTILETAEQMEDLAAELPPEAGERLTAAVTTIYEACNFQDITGQRITKTIRILQHIEQRIEAMQQLFEGGLADKASGAEPADAQARDVKTDEDESGERELINGPQLPGEAMSQDDIDALLRDGD